MIRFAELVKVNINKRTHKLFCFSFSLWWFKVLLYGAKIIQSINWLLQTSNNVHSNMW